MQRGTVLFVAASILAVGVIGGGVFYGTTQPTQPTQPTRIERTMACIDRLGYAAYTYHDDGRERFHYPEGTLVLDDGTYQARPPADIVIVTIPGGKVGEIRVPDHGDPAAQIVDHGTPLNPDERAAVAACADV